MPTLRRVPRHLVKPESRLLSDHAQNVTSQFGEDGILKRIFEIMPPANRWCVEFGAWDGKYLSNTWTLIHDQGWSAVLIEGDADRAARLASESRALEGRVHVRQALVGWEGDDRLDALLAATPIPQNFDMLSIDVDGNDWHIWKAIESYRPRIVIIEHNPTASNQLYFVQDADPAVNQGCSLLAAVALGREKGYELIATTATNGIFVVAEEFGRFGIADNSLDAMHPEIVQTEICFGYDGTVIAAGHMMAHWQNLPLSQEDFQVLPVHARKYSYPG